jgi:hypothetical protein
MAEGISQTKRHELLNRYRGIPATAQPTLYVGLLTAPPPETGDCSGIEISGNGYARVPVQSNTSNWSLPSNRAIQNAVRILTGPATPAGWPAPQGIGLFRDDSTAIADFFGAIDRASAIQVNDRFKFNPTALVVRYDAAARGAGVVVSHGILDTIRGVTFTGENQYYLGFGLSDPKQTGDINEVSGGNYERYLVPADTSFWAEPTLGAITNLEEFVLPWDADSDITIRSVGLFSSATGGAAELYAPLSYYDPVQGRRVMAPKSLSAGDNLVVRQNMISLSL